MHTDTRGLGLLIMIADAIATCTGLFDLSRQEWLFFNSKILYNCAYSPGNLNWRFRCGPKWSPPTAGIHWQHAKTQIVAQRCRPGLPWGHRAGVGGGGAISMGVPESSREHGLDLPLSLVMHAYSADPIRISRCETIYKFNSCIQLFTASVRTSASLCFPTLATKK
eukprot:SAG11_NODE_1085_length_5939_cov_9.908390_3_plen_166_part_00